LPGRINAGMIKHYKTIVVGDSLTYRALFKRLNLKFNGELIYLAVADEERGGEKGAGWLKREHPELLRADYVLNEGGGMPLQV